MITLKLTEVHFLFQWLFTFMRLWKVEFSEFSRACIWSSRYSPIWGSDDLHSKPWRLLNSFVIKSISFVRSSGVACTTIGSPKIHSFSKLSFNQYLIREQCSLLLIATAADAEGCSKSCTIPTESHKGDRQLSKTLLFTSLIIEFKAGIVHPIHFSRYCFDMISTWRFKILWSLR